MKFRFIKLTLIFTICSSSISLFADASKPEDKRIDLVFNSFKMEKIQAEMITETMAKRGRLTTDEVNRIKRNIASVKDKDISDLNVEISKRLNLNNSMTKN